MTPSPQEDPPHRILVADDDQSIRQLVSTIIKREGFTTDTAIDGLEAIQLIEQHDYTVILLDLMMPRLDGFGVIDWLKKNPPLNKPIVIVITAYADQRFKEVDPQLVAGVLRKPFEVAELGNIVRACVNGFVEEVSQKLSFSTDRALRDFARGGETKGNS